MKIKERNIDLMLFIGYYVMIVQNEFDTPVLRLVKGK